MSWIFRSFRKKKDKHKEEKKQSKDSKHNEKTSNVEEQSLHTATGGDKSLDIVDIVDNAGPLEKQPKIKKITEFADAFLNYEPKQRGSHHGRGLCVVFSLFTADLQGYIQDVQVIQEFFGQLEYEVWCKNGFQNLTKDELFQKIIEVRRHITAHGNIDRLMLVILTHGNEEGLLTCADKEGLQREQITTEMSHPNGRTVFRTESVLTKVEEIVDCFKHDTVPSLKDMPKVFLIQACRGSEIVRAANQPKLPEDISEDQVDASALQFNPVSPIDADIMICYAATDNNSSLVHPKTGSWFIQQTIEVFRRHYKTQHIADMMTVVKLAVAELRGIIQNKDGPPTEAVQIPCIFSTFRKRFYLYNQPQLYTLNIDRSKYARYT